MKAKLSRFASIAAVLAAATLATALPARAEVEEVRFARQIDIAYLPLALMEHDKLVEKHAARLGLSTLSVNWVHLRGGSSLNDALLSGQVDYAAGGIPPMVVLWDRTRGNANVKGVAPINRQCFDLNTNNPAVQTLKDFTDRDRIAVPSIRVSIQAIVLQMAAEKEFGPGKHGQLDRLTVAMSHPDGVVALTSGRSEITAHFTTPPFMYQEQQAPSVRKLLSSCDVFGSNPSFSVLWSTEKFRSSNPKVYQAVLAALEEAVGLVKADPQRTADIYVKLTNSKLPNDLLLKMITAQDNQYSTVPDGVMTYANFMNKIGLIKTKPESWRDLFFADIHNKNGS